MSKRPNVLIFMLDTQRVGNMSCYGYDKPTTPNIDAVADEGALFVDNISPAIWTLPSVASLMTGLYVSSHGSGAHNESFGGDFTTMADVFSDLDYKTVAFYGNIYGAMSHKGFRETHLIPGFDKRIGPDVFEVSRDRIEQIKRWLDHHAGADATHPFFMYVQIMDPHMRYHPAPEFRERFVPADVTDEEIEAIDVTPIAAYAGKKDYTRRELDILLALSDASTASADSHVGVMMEALRERGLLDETIVFIMSDHGEMFCEHKNLAGAGHFTHHLACYEELIKVPLVARWPEAFPAGARVEASTQTHDIFPTLAELVGFEAPHCQGFSLAPAAQGRGLRDYTLTEYQKSVHIAARVKRDFPEVDQRLYMRTLKALRRRPWKYIWASDMRDELYRLDDDPRENRNLVGEMPEKQLEMRLYLEELMTRFPQAVRPDLILGADQDPALTRTLEALGFYLRF